MQYFLCLNCTNQVPEPIVKEIFVNLSETTDSFEKVANLVFDKKFLSRNIFSRNPIVEINMLNTGIGPSPHLLVKTCKESYFVKLVDRKAWDLVDHESWDSTYGILTSVYPELEHDREIVFPKSVFKLRNASMSLLNTEKCYYLVICKFAENRGTLADILMKGIVDNRGMVCSEMTSLMNSCGHFFRKFSTKYPLLTHGDLTLSNVLVDSSGFTLVDCTGASVQESGRQAMESDLECE
jgi:hypothetical protein